MTTPIQQPHPAPDVSFTDFISDFEIPEKPQNFAEALDQLSDLIAHKKDWSVLRWFRFAKKLAKTKEEATLLKSARHFWGVYVGDSYEFTQVMLGGAKVFADQSSCLGNANFRLVCPESVFSKDDQKRFDALNLLEKVKGHKNEVNFEHSKLLRSIQIRFDDLLEEVSAIAD